MKITKDNLSVLADRSKNNPLVMPNLLDSNFVAEQLGKKSLADLSVEDQLDFAQRHGYVPYIGVGGADPFAFMLIHLAAERFPTLRWQEDKVEDDLEVKRWRRLKTPYAELSEKTIHNKKTHLTHHVEIPIKDEHELKAFAWVVKESVKAVLDDRQRIKEEILGRIVPEVGKIRGRGLSVIRFCTPVFEVLYPFFDQQGMIYIMADHPLLIRELMDLSFEYTQFLIEIGIEAKVDAMFTALWAYEQWSPKIYEDNVIPYVVPIGKTMQNGGPLFWIHTCGRMKDLIEQKIYHKLKPDILECLNYPPAGNIDGEDWPRLRRMLPEHVITKGNLEDSLLWNGPIDEIKKKTKQLLKQSEGFKHILGTSNNVFDGTPLAHFEAMIEAAREYSLT